MALRVFYSPKDNATTCSTRTSPFLKRSRLTAPSPSFVNANRNYPMKEWSCYVDLWPWRCYRSGKGIEKNYLGYFNDSADGRHLLFWLGLSYVKPCPPVHWIFHPHSISAAWLCVSWALYRLVYSKFHRNVDACACNWYQAAFSPPSAVWVRG